MKKSQMAANKTKEDIELTLANNAKAIVDLQNEVAQSIAENIKPTEEKLSGVDNAVQGLHKSVATFEDRHVETFDRIKEVAVLSSNIQVQI